MTLRSAMLAGQSSTVILRSANHLEVVLALWVVGVARYIYSYRTVAARASQFGAWGLTTNTGNSPQIQKGVQSTPCEANDSIMKLEYMKVAQFFYFSQYSNFLDVPVYNNNQLTPNESFFFFMWQL